MSFLFDEEETALEPESISSGVAEEHADEPSERTHGNTISEGNSETTIEKGVDDWYNFDEDETSDGCSGRKGKSKKKTRNYWYNEEEESEADAGEQKEEMNSETGEKEVDNGFDEDDDAKKEDDEEEDDDEKKSDGEEEDEEEDKSSDKESDEEEEDEDEDEDEDDKKASKDYWNKKRRKVKKSRCSSFDTWDAWYNEDGADPAGALEPEVDNGDGAAEPAKAPADEGDDVGSYRCH